MSNRDFLSFCSDLSIPKRPICSDCTLSVSKQKNCHTGWLRSIWMQRIGTGGSHGSNLVWRPLKAVGATLRALPFKHRFFRCRENNPQHRYNIKVSKHNTQRVNFKSTHLHLEVNECQQWGPVFMHRLCVLVCMCKCSLHFFLNEWTPGRHSTVISGDVP